MNDVLQKGRKFGWYDPTRDEIDWVTPKEWILRANAKMTALVNGIARRERNILEMNRLAMCQVGEDWEPEAYERFQNIVRNTRCIDHPAEPNSQN